MVMKNKKEPSFQPPDTSMALRAGLISGVFGLVIIVLVTVAVGRSQINTGTITDIFSRAHLLPMMLSLFIMSVAFLFLGLRVDPGRCQAGTRGGSQHVHHPTDRSSARPRHYHRVADGRRLADGGSPVAFITAGYRAHCC